MRIYPIRFTRKNWIINFYSLNENNNKTNIKLSTFDKNNPLSENNQLLYNIDEKVIKDEKFTIILNYPLSYNFTISISSDNGFTLKELIYSIKILYEFIYEEEERTAIPQTYNLKKVCSSCNIKELENYSLNIEDNDDDCSICYESLDKYACKINCNHIFHKHCLKEWLKNSKTCPICRTNIFLCHRCDGGIIYYQFNGVVIPLEYNLLIRNNTNGIFGIYGYYMEDLILNYMFYDNVDKKLLLKFS